MKMKIGDFINRKGMPDLDIELNEKDCAIAFGLSLKRLRKLNNISLDKLSEQINITNPSMNRYESGYNLPSIFNALKIAKYFDTNIEQMIFCGIFELYDKNNGKNTENDEYIEKFVGIGTKINKLLENKNKLTFQDHKKAKK